MASRKANANVVDKDTYDALSRARYLEKLKDIGGKDPYEFQASDWSDDVEGYPDITYPDIVNYLVNSVSAYTLDQLKAYKSLQAYNYFVSDYVQDVRQRVIGDKCVMAARVRHSQRSTVPLLPPSIISQKDGRVISGHCTCMAGLGEVCSHVAALLFAVEASVKLRDSKTVTEEKSYWLLPSAVKNVQYKMAKDIDFTSAKTKKRKLDRALLTGETPSPMKRRKQPNVKEPSDCEVSSFFKNFKSGGTKPVLLSLIPEYAKDYRPAALGKRYPKVLSELFDDSFISSSKESLMLRCDKLFSEIQVTEEEAINCEKDTRSQANSKHWFAFRSGRITASKIKTACRSSPQSPSISLIKSICYPVTTNFSTPGLQWGSQHEETALKEYETQMKEHHENFNLRHSGLILNPEYPFMGATPDGIASCDCCGDVIVEVKCPYCKREETVSDSFDCLETRDGGLCLKRTHSYFYQVQCQLLVSNKNVVTLSFGPNRTTTVKELY